MQGTSPDQVFNLGQDGNFINSSVHHNEDASLQLHLLLFKSHQDALDKNHQLLIEKNKAEEEILSLQKQLTEIKSELEVFKQENNNVIKEREGRASSSNSDNDGMANYCEFTITEVKRATGDFAKRNMIGEGEYSAVYKGSLCHTEVAIKKLNIESRHGVKEFIQEVEILSRVRHPNLITLIGACEEARALVYEFLPNGSLEDRLECKNNTTPLSWHTRINIALDVCSALIFLHSPKPHGIAHGDLKPSNILLDSNNRSKVSDFGCGRPLIHYSNNTVTPFHHTNYPHGTLAYLDPEYLQTGVLTTQSDVYSFGLILLQLVTGKKVIRLRRLVQEATLDGGLNILVDNSGGEWPLGHAKEMIKLGLKCSEPSRDKRLDLSKDVWISLKRMVDGNNFNIRRWVTGRS